MSIGYQPVPYIKPAAPPGGVLIGFNFRQTAGFVDDGDDEVWAGWLANTPYPTQLTTPNGTSVFCGWSSLPGGRPTEGRNETVRDPRFSGWVGLVNQYDDREAFSVRLDVGTYRIRCYCNRQLGTTSHYVQLWDGTRSAAGRSMVKQFQTLSNPVDTYYTIATPDAVNRAYADAIANYATDYWELTLSDNGAETGIYVEITAPGQNGQIAHLQVEQV